MKRFWLGVALFLVVLTGTLPVISLIAPQTAAADGGKFHFGDEKDPYNFDLRVKVIDAAHMQVTATGNYDMADGRTSVNVGPLISGMYYDNNIGDNWGRGDLSSDADYAQGGGKKTGVIDGCQSHIRISFKEYKDLDNDYNQYMDNNGIGENIKGIFFKFSFSPKGTNATQCIDTDYMSNDTPFLSLENKENFNIGYFFSAFTETPINDVQTIQGGTITEADDDGTYDSDAQPKFTATYSQKNDFKFNKDHPWWGGRCPNFITVAGTGRLANTRSGKLYDQDNAGGNDCKLTDGDGNPRAVLILTNKPSEVVQGNTDPNPSGDDDTVGQVYNDKCPIDTWGLKWIVCPIIEAINKTIQSISEAIQDYVTNDAEEIFGNASVKKAFNSFRTIAISLAVVAAVFMVVAQASGLEILNAYTIKRFLPQIGGVMIIVLLLWPLLHWATAAFSAVGHWVTDALYAPFSELGNAKAADGWTLLTTIGTGGALFAALGPFGLISLILTAFLSVLMAIVVITIIKMAFIASIILMPLLIIASRVPGLEKVGKMGLSVYVGGNVFPIAFGGLVALGKIGAVLMPGPGALKSIGSTVAILAPYWAAKDLAERSIGALNTITGKATGFIGKMQASQANSRKNIMKQRGADFKSGSLYRNRGIGERINNIGRRVSVGKAGRYGFGRQGAAALQMQTALDQKSAMERNKWMQDLANDDRANAVLGLSGGSEAGMRDAARDIFTNDSGVYDEDAANSAIAKARAASGGRVNRAAAAAALQTMAQNKSRAIGAGRTDIVDRGIERLTNNVQERNALRYGYEYNSRNAGRADLGGDWTGGAVQTAAAELAANSTYFQNATGGANNRAVAVANAMDGMGRTTVGQMMNGHTNQARANVDAIQNTLQHGSAERQMEALYRANEIAKNLSSANGDSQGVFNNFIEGGLGINTGSATPISQQLAQRQLNLTPMGRNNTYTDAQTQQIQALANRIENGSRAYGNAMAYQGGQNQPAPAGGKTP